MKSINIVNGPQNVSVIIQGCMRMPALSKEDAYLVTGNIKHFPKTPIVVTPAELLEIMQQHGIL